jgi:hypothetical protein
LEPSPGPKNNCSWVSTASFSFSFLRPKYRQEQFKKEHDLVNFLKILTGGYSKSNPASREKGL